MIELGKVEGGVLIRGAAVLVGHSFEDGLSLKVYDPEARDEVGFVVDGLRSRDFRTSGTLWAAVLETAQS